MPLYFAYGSNLLSTRLGARCPSARVVGRARAPGAAMAFAKRAQQDGSGKATLLAEPDFHQRFRSGSGPAPVRAQGTPGVIYDLSPQDVAVLDAIEGVGRGYDRVDAFELQGDTGWIEAMTYIATAPEPGLKPFDWYLALILAGMLEHGFDADTIAQTAATPCWPDPDPASPGQVAARAALQAAGRRVDEVLALASRPPG